MAGARVFVTGGTGFLGRRLVTALALAGHEVIASARGPAPPDAGVLWTHLDLMDPDAVRAAMQMHRPTHLVHLGWRAVRGDIYSSPENNAWLRSSLDLARSFAAAGGQRLVGCGSCYEYAFGPERLIEESSPLLPTSAYGQAKVALWRGLKQLSAACGLSAAWGRVFFAYGPGEYEKRLVPDVIGALRRGEPARTSHGKFARDFVFVNDVAEAFVALTEADAPGAFNIGSGVAPLLCDVVAAIGDLTGRSDLLRIGALDARAEEPETICADPDRMARVIGWAARTPLSVGLSETLAWHTSTFPIPAH